MTIAVLGAGMVGRAIALDLARNYLVTAFDRDGYSLERIKQENNNISIVGTDLSQYQEYANILASFDIVITAVPGFMGYRTLEAVIGAGKNVVDISFFPEDALQLHSLAESNNVTAITDCGIAPGFSNLVAGRYNEEIKIDSFECYVGGLPKDRKPPFQYKAPFSPIDVIQEYLRPARLVENGTIVTKPAMSDREMIFFDEIGELEAFNTDGLRSLLYTLKNIPDMKEKTLRYPGHIDLILALKQAGFFDTTTLQIGEDKIIPLEFTSRLLVNEWKLGPEEEEFTVMRMIIKGEKQGRPETIEYNLLDRYDPKTKISSMARTTGYTCTAAVHLLANGLFTSKGVFPPELVGKDKKCFDFVVDHLAAHGVNWAVTAR